MTLRECFQAQLLLSIHVTNGISNYNPASDVSIYVSMYRRLCLRPHSHESLIFFRSFGIHIF